MTTEAPETTDEVISRDAHERVKREKAALQDQVDKLSGTVIEMGKKEIVRSHFATKGLGPEDAEWAAKFSLPSIPDDTVADQLGTYLDENFARLYPKDDSTPDVPVDGAEKLPDTGDIPTPDANEPPGFARPSPAGDGQPPGVKIVTVDDDEFKDLLKSGDEAGLKELVTSDRFRYRTTLE